MKNGKKFIWSYLLAIILVVTIINGSTVPTVQAKAKTDVEKINFKNYPRDSRERYVASLALKKNISYKEADILEKQEMSIQSLDEVKKYKTIDKKAGTIANTSISYKQPVYITTEVRYIWNKATNRLVYIEDLGGPLTYLPGISSNSVSMYGGDIVKEQYSKSARISQTVYFTYEDEGWAVTVGGDILSVTKSGGGYRITTRSKTYAITIGESDLR